MVNFVRHVRAVMYKLEADSRIEVYHVSLYWALFQTWNEHRFQNPMRIYRDEIMARAKIRTRTAYAKCMRELVQWNYFTYDPSTRRFEPWLVTMRQFDGARHTPVEASRYPLEAPVAEAETEPASGPENGTTAGTTAATRTRTTPGTTMPTDGGTHLINGINDPNLQNGVNADEQACPISNFGNDLTPAAAAPGVEEKSNARGAGGASAEAIPASLDHVYPFFAALRSTRVEAEKFFHYFTSNGWRVGGRSPMRDWRAAARNWVLNAVRFHEPNGPTPGSLASPGPQNYTEGL